MKYYLSRMLHRSNARVSQQTLAVAGKPEIQGPIESEEQITMTTKKTSAKPKAVTTAKPVEAAAEAVQETVEAMLAGCAVGRRLC